MASLRKTLVDDVHGIRKSADMASDDMRKLADAASGTAKRRHDWTDWLAAIVALISLAVSLAALCVANRQLEVSGPVWSLQRIEKDGRVEALLVSNTGQSAGLLGVDGAAVYAPSLKDDSISIGISGMPPQRELRLDSGERAVVLLVFDEGAPHHPIFCSNGGKLKKQPEITDTAEAQSYVSIPGWDKAKARCLEDARRLTDEPEYRFNETTDENGNLSVTP